MLGIELQRSDRPARSLPGPTPALLEYASPHATSYRIPSGATIDAPAEAVLTVIRGDVSDTTGGHHRGGETAWIARPCVLTARENTLALLTVV